MNPFGVSFILRVRNEQGTLDQALASLAGVTIPHEIVVILNRCTDDCVKIALRASSRQPVRVAYDDAKLSRAGLETLITDASSDHSLPSYYNRCFAKARYPWKFKYDADFIASEALVTFLNHELAGFETPTRIRLPCQWDAISNEEVYLSNCLLHHAKHVFWESPRYAPLSQEVLRRDLPIRHLAKLSDVKRYWLDPPWFMYGDDAEAKEIRRRWGVVRALAGEEPIGAARASNPECDAYLARIMAVKPRLEQEGISFFR